MLRPVPFAIDEYYHVYNRGVDKRVIFSSPQDYLRFTSLLYLANGTKDVIFEDVDTTAVFSHDRGEPIVAICGYCLMPNHFHFLLYEIIDGGITKFMRKMCTGYSMYFNKKYERTGALLQGRFKAKHVNDDEYLRHLLTYIHMNALDLVQTGWKEQGLHDKKRANDFLGEYQYSSLPDYLEAVIRPESEIISKDDFPSYYESSVEMMDDIHLWQDIIPTFEK